MKCLRLKSGEVRKVSDKEAAKIIKLKNGSYCPKSVYKGIRRSKC